MSDILITQEMIDIISNIKNDIRSTRNKVLVSANQELIYLYFRIGKTISENSKYGSNFINTLSSSLKTEFPGSTGFSPRNLTRMRKFNEVYGDLSNLPPAAAKLPWIHNSILVEKIDNNEVRAWYAQKCLDNGWNKVVLDHQIDLCLYERQAYNNKKIRNFEATLPATQSELATDMMKDPYIFELANLKEKALEKNVEEAMLNSVKNVLM